MPYEHASLMPAPRPGLLMGPARAMGLVIACLAGLCGLSACGKPLQGRGVAIAGSQGSEATPYFVQVENRLGTVRVHARPNLTQPMVRAQVPGSREPRLATWIAASIEEGGDQRVLRVLSADPALANTRVTLDVYVPSAKGVTIRNAGGNVELWNVAGPIQVLNGQVDGNGGDVKIRTTAALAGPVDLRTRNGNVLLAMGRGSVGKIDASGRTISVRTDEAAPANVQSNGRSYVANLGLWGQDFMLRAPEGTITVRVTE